MTKVIKRRRDILSNGSRVTLPMIVECDRCRAHVELYSAITNECECGQLYNGFGQRLRPRHEWRTY